MRSIIELIIKLIKSFFRFDQDKGKKDNSNSDDGKGDNKRDNDDGKDEERNDNGDDEPKVPEVKISETKGFEKNSKGEYTIMNKLNKSPPDPNMWEVWLIV